MIDRRGFIGLMLGAAVAPKGVLQGLTTPAPIRQAVEIAMAKWTIVHEDLVDLMRNLKEGELMAFTVEVEVKGLGGSDEEWKARSGPLEIKAEPV